MVCDKLPFIHTNMREAIDVTIAGGAVRYTHVVRLRESAEAKPEQGTGTLSGQDISLQGAWDGGARQYKASYSGSFVRRSASSKAPRPGPTAARPSPAPAPARSSARSRRSCRATRNKP